MNRSGPQGFTLIELSIVLVIIGLVVGSVFVGRDLIEAARYRSVLNEGEQVRQGVYAFKLKFNCLPGDCPEMTRFYPANPTCRTAGIDPAQGACNGGGDQMICGPNDVMLCDAWGWETLYAVHDLQITGFVTMPLKSPLDVSVVSGGTVEAEPGRNLFASAKFNKMGWALQSSRFYDDPIYYNGYFCPGVFGGGSSSANQLFFVGRTYAHALGQGDTFRSFTGADAAALDRKADDGKPFTGNIIAMMNPGYGGWYTSLPGACSSPLSNGIYVDSRSSTGTGLVFVTNF